MGSESGREANETGNNESLKIISRILDIFKSNIHSMSFILLLFISFTANSVVIFGEDAVGTTPLQNEVGNPALQFIYIAIFLAVAIKAYYTKGAKFLINIPLFFSLLLVWCWMSLIWAVDPEIALRRTGLMTISMLTVTYIVRSLAYTKVISLLAWSFAFMLIADWVSIALFPLSLHSDGDLAGNWRGIHNHKNEAGALCAFSSILFVHIALRSRSMLCGPITIVLSLCFLYMTSSKTSIWFVFVAIGIGAFANYSFYHHKIRNTMFVIIVSLVVASLTFADDQIDKLLSILDDPSAFTGRAQIWLVLTNYVADHPLLGAGYGSFWNIGNASPIFDYTSGSTITLSHAHNGYLGLLVEVGGVGLTLAILGLVLYPLYILFFRPLRPDVSRSLICSIIAFGCLHNLLESSLLDRAAPIWLIMLIMYCLLSDAGAVKSESL